MVLARGVRSPSPMDCVSDCCRKGELGIGGAAVLWLSVMCLKGDETSRCLSASRLLEAAAGEDSKNRGLD